tara:strand:- start:42 stop:299 length:258 start_codon:yes stop_codon:yes gene_type:complete
MTHLYVDCEAELESGLDVATELALLQGDDKVLELTFPSKFMCKLFMNNLMLHWFMERIPVRNGLEIRLNVPADIRDIENDWGTDD